MELDRSGIPHGHDIRLERDSIWAHWSLYVEGRLVHEGTDIDLRRPPASVNEEVSERFYAMVRDAQNFEQNVSSLNL